jgi:hypothetical protein
MTEKTLQRLRERFPTANELTLRLVAEAGFRMPDAEELTEEIIRARLEIEAEESEPCRP